jgi:hypothetical protein
MVTIRFELGALELAAGSPNPKLNRPPLTHTAKTGPLLYHEKKTEEMSKKIKTTNKETISPGNTHF